MPWRKERLDAEVSAERSSNADGMDEADANHPEHVVADQLKYRTGTDCFLPD